MTAKRPLTRWSVTSIKALPARSSPYTDPGCAGLQLFVRARLDGTLSRTWLLRIKWRDEELRLALGTHPETTLEAARKEVNRLRELARQGIDPRTVRARRTPRPAPLPGGAALAPENQHSVDFLVSEFIERHLRPRRKRPEWAEQILAKHVLPEWSGRDARAIKPREVIALLDGIVARGRRVMANRCASLLGQMFKFGIHRQIVELSPVQLLFQPGGEEKSRDRVLEDAELAVLLKNGARYARLSHVVTLLLLTGARRGELAAARWADVDLAERVWTIPPENSKTGVAMLVPLTDWAVREFEALKKLAKRSPWVLPGTDASQHLEPRLLTRGVAKNLARLEQLGVAGFRLHDLRRTLRTGLARLKVEDHIAERCLNHVQGGVAGVYNRHSYLAEKREALTKWAAHLEELRA